MIQRDTIVSRNETLMSAPVDRDIVVLNVLTDSYVALDEIGRRIWELMERPLRVEDLVGQLARQYDAPSEAIAGDVLGFLQELEREGMVHAGDGPVS